LDILHLWDVPPEINPLKQPLSDVAGVVGTDFGLKDYIFMI